MYCINCGKDLPDGARVCPECGTPQSGNAAQPAPPVHPAYAVKTEEPPVSVGDWMITALLTAIPLVGFIMLFVWGFGGNVNTSKKNWARSADLDGDQRRACPSLLAGLRYVSPLVLLLLLIC